MLFDKKFWNNKYINKETGWDLGQISHPLKEFIDQLFDKDLAILVPGAGNAYEVEYLWKKGFNNSHIVDISEKALLDFQARVPDFPVEQIILKDFFDLKGNFDLILEQTFFCALPKDMRKAYVRHMHALLKEDGHLAGLLFNVPLNDDHPPFGGSEDEYRALFKEHFEIIIMEKAYNSVPPREGRELFFKLRKKT